MQKGSLCALHLTANSFRDQPARKPAPLKVWVSAYAADLSEPAGAQALASHSHQALSVEKAEVIAKFYRPRTERSRAGQVGQLECSGRVFQTEFYSLR